MNYPTKDRPQAGFAEPAQSKYTLGPWDFHIADNAPTYHVAIEAEGERLADVYNEANARLIAVSPELLEAAQKVLAHLNARIEQAPRDAVPVFEGIADLHDAVAKATGEPL